MPSRDHSAEPKTEDRSARIVHDGPEHVWRQIADDIIAQISSGELPPNTRLPNEYELARIYGVARDTVRTAKRNLVKESYLQIARGRGTFVRPDHPKRRRS